MNDALATWVPVPILIGVITVLIAVLYAIGRAVANKMLDQFAELKAQNVEQTRLIGELRFDLSTRVTVDQHGTSTTKLWEAHNALRERVVELQTMQRMKP